MKTARLVTEALNLLTPEQLEAVRDAAVADMCAQLEREKARADRLERKAASAALVLGAGIAQSYFAMTLGSPFGPNAREVLLRAAQEAATLLGPELVRENV